MCLALFCVYEFLVCIDTPRISKLRLNLKPVHGISNNVVCANSKASDQPAHTRSLIGAFVSR